jgi:hypothetical protein
MEGLLVASKEVDLEANAEKTSICPCCFNRVLDKALNKYK